ncbi:hypothetical protein HanPSC8_Chr16g0694201 [Helianthus annuus]|nr:hypothetical protein HanPSC8_Chr16g0694201 [Helianthus annuus]
MILSVRCRSYDSNSWHHSYTHIGILKECGVDNKISKWYLLWRALGTQS